MAIFSGGVLKKFLIYGKRWIDYAFVHGHKDGKKNFSATLKSGSMRAESYQSHGCSCEEKTGIRLLLAEFVFLKFIDKFAEVNANYIRGV